MKLEDLHKLQWYIDAPEFIKAAIDTCPPIVLYKFKDSGKQCYIISYEEPKGGAKKIDEVTVTVQKTGEGGAMAEMGLGQLDTNKVFGVTLADLIPWESDEEE